MQCCASHKSAFMVNGGTQFCDLCACFDQFCLILHRRTVYYIRTASKERFNSCQYYYNKIKCCTNLSIWFCSGLRRRVRVSSSVLPG